VVPSSAATAAQLPLPLPDAVGQMPVMVDVAPVLGRRAEADLHRRLAQLFGEPIDLVATNNRRSLVSWKWTGGLLQLRVQRHFALAGDPVLASIVRMVKDGDALSRHEVLQFAASFNKHLPTPKPRFSPPAGQHHDLRHHMASQGRRWFHGDFLGRIGWSLVGKGRVRKRIRLGSWSEDHRLIRVHPVLDSPDVPGFVIDFVVFHEMVHAAVGPQLVNGRRLVHTARFREFEALHPDRLRAEAWIRENIDSLLTW
jgi:hypothetical protein